MAEQYNDEVSRHYAAYRPPIHQEILGAAFPNPNDAAFKLGLDTEGSPQLALKNHIDSMKK
ncbi:hypothetical protein [uncultured Vibrio sp.]|uniref:hypothetical protein n=1 Tax=uncultured Vibrio sp. TaxID=114054 RepID=UPI00261B15B6|nr:hypothetical protein [uncultured Vibrio sp.]